MKKTATKKFYLNLFLICSQNTVPNNTTKKIARTLQIAVNGGIFLNKKTTNEPPQNKIFTTMLVGVSVAGYTSKNSMT
jgi:hypothetical protein